MHRYNVVTARLLSIKYTANSTKSRVTGRKRLGASFSDPEFAVSSLSRSRHPQTTKRDIDTFQIRRREIRRVANLRLRRATFYKSSDLVNHVKPSYKPSHRVNHHGKVSAGRKKDNVKLVSIDKHSPAGHSVWRAFTSTLMRNGLKVRYQSILRKALSAV